MHRIFAALPVPSHISERLLPLRNDLPGASWRLAQHHHVTLQYYGDVQIEMAEEVAAALEQIQAPALELRLDGVGWFGRKEPRAIYARIGGLEALDQLANNCRKIAHRFGLKIDSKPFKPHITLAYCKDTPLEMVRAWSEDFQTLRSEPFLIDSFHLYESFTGHARQNRYEPQADYQLI